MRSLKAQFESYKGPVPEHQLRKALFAFIVGLTHGVKQKILWIVVIDQCGATLVDTMATVNLERGNWVPLLGVNSDNGVYTLRQLTPTAADSPLADGVLEESETMTPFIVIGLQRVVLISFGKTRVWPR